MWRVGGDRWGESWEMGRRESGEGGRRWVEEEVGRWVDKGVGRVGEDGWRRVGGDGGGGSREGGERWNRLVWGREVIDDGCKWM